MRHDALLIWGHGLPDLDGILDIVRADPGFEIRRVLERAIDDLPRFVRSVYNFDYAPYRHLMDKTRYLLQTPPRFAVIFVDNLDPEEHETGKGRFAHIECRRMTALKRAIRDAYNPRVAGRPSEHHVVHGTDHVGQTDAIVKLLGYRTIGEMLSRSQTLVPAPEHLPPARSWTLRSIPLGNVFARLARGPETAGHLLLPLGQTPHALLLNGDPEPYTQYWRANRGTRLNDDHAPEAFRKLADTLDYLGGRYCDNYLLLQPLDEERYVLLDGVHRASILRARGDRYVIGAVAA